MAFVNLQRLMSLNADRGEADAQKALDDSGASKAATSAEYSAIWHQGGLNNGAEMQQRVADAQAKAKTISNPAGMAGAGKAGVLDGALMGQSQAGQQYQQRANNLTKLMGDARAGNDARQRQVAANNRYAGMKQEADAREEQRRTGGIDADTGQVQAAYDKWKAAAISGHPSAAALRTEYQRLLNQAHTRNKSISDYEKERQGAAARYAESQKAKEQQKKDDEEAAANQAKNAIQ